MPLFDFVCPDGHVTELLRPAAVHEAGCQCGQVAVRGEVNLISMQLGADANWSPLVRDNGRIRTPVPERRYAARAYMEASAEIAYRHEHTEQTQGRELPGPQFYKMAQARAQRLRTAGITDSLDA